MYALMVSDSRGYSSSSETLVVACGCFEGIRGHIYAALLVFATCIDNEDGDERRL